MSSYVFWANKGGIGKSTMTFQLACATAKAIGVTQLHKD
jgi:cellulose biosynthesis protein BcsQ